MSPVEDDQYSDAPDTFEDERYDDLPRGIEEVEVRNVESPHKAITDVITTEEDKEETRPLLESSRGASLSTTREVEQTSDAASAHSVPAVQVTPHPDPPETQRRLQTATPSSARSARAPPPSPARSHHSVRPSTASDDRRVRRRSITEVRTSNRLSGFFNNLMHRREPLAHADDSICEERPSALHGKNIDTSRPPTPPGRSTTPPPDLPPPSLQELGLSLSVLTSDLSPSHFSTPPASGAFLSPHYLLLCHAQGLDVLPLISPPAPQPYALVRRVSFKSVVVMEQRGVLVAIAGRRDGVRVYALEEVKRAVEWRIEVELRRERERQRRETTKKFPSGVREAPEPRDSAEKLRRPFSSTPPPGDGQSAKVSNGPFTSSPPVVPLIPRTPTTHRRQRTRTPAVPSPVPSGHPPPYTSPSPERLTSQVANLSPPHARSRGTSVSEVLTAGSIRRNTNATVRPEDPDAKADWVESSDDEAISLVAAGSSGSQALDERTSAAAQTSSTIPLHTTPRHPRPMSMSRSNRPANLDLSLSRSNTVVPPEPSPAPTLLTLRQALSHSPSREPHARLPSTPLGDDDDDDADGISLSQVLQESRIPDLPPPGSRQPQQPILISSSHPVTAGDDEPSSPRTSDAHSSVSVRSLNDRSLPGRRRRWSVIMNQSNESDLANEQQLSVTPPMRERLPNLLTRSTSFRSTRSASGMRPSSSPNDASSLPTLTPPPMPDSALSVMSSHSSRTSRFIPRILSSAFHHRRSDERPSSPSGIPDESSKRAQGAPLIAQSPPPKLEYVKLPGTKGALLVKAVETAKKSFLAILCGDNGERVELFAGTYRTALGLSRTFILPDSPRSLELQLQGDDLVEVFLVFSQNVFGLEPATVRVREVRIGRAERRAARRRAREVRATDAGANESEPQIGEEDTNVNVSIGVSVAVGSTVVATGSGPDGQQTPPLVASQHPIDRRTASESATERPSTPPETTTTSTVAHPEEIVALATAQMGPYTTFQQLSFAPKFPLASIADEYVIPPTYPDFIDYRNEHEPEMGSGSDLSQVQFSPPGLPIPTPSAPSKWYYRDPKNIVHGPWKASLMQAWYKDGLLPPDLPVRREEDSDFMLLKDLRLQSIDPTHPFRTVPPQIQDISPRPLFQPSDKPLLKPISLLSQPRHFGPPALFFSSRGGHSTTIVDNRGRSVLKGRFVWSKDAQEDSKHAVPSRMGDVKRLEAFDVKDRSVLVAMRQGGLEAVDLSDALLKPGDESRTALPQYNPSPSNFNRRGPFVWKIGTPISGSSSAVLPSKPKISHSHYTSGKKSGSGPSKSPAGRTEFNVGHVESEMNDEVLFLGRKDDEIYICERNAGSFRILRLCPNV
ncbi:uncharacterized protein ARMOST_09352 [Armillaria ostoyae]|uniref:GYF domain-containing protein n=1 Tax=Armillaria ostoyae TaxID=47428 RepID=A0A284RB81_ARMOS|nr:uncharacterized protein ARMOST_09352 [Armillaria ostoyae]